MTKIIALSLLATTALLSPARADHFVLQATFANDHYIANQYVCPTSNTCSSTFSYNDMGAPIGLLGSVDGLNWSVHRTAPADFNMTGPGRTFYPSWSYFEHGSLDLGSIRLRTTEFNSGYTDFYSILDIGYVPYGDGFQIIGGRLTTTYWHFGGSVSDPGTTEYDLYFGTGLTGTICPEAGCTVPGPIVGAGIPGLILAGGLFSWWRRRRVSYDMDQS